MKSTRVGKFAFWGVIVFVGLLFVGSMAFVWFSRDHEDGRAMVVEREKGKNLYPVVIREHSFHPEIESGKFDTKGQPIMVACATCHDNRTANKSTNSASLLDEFHQNLNYHHGELSCASCHNANDYNTLKKADGTVLAFDRSIELCAQCHGPQYRDYQNGSHGGMSGFWDRTRGPRLRNTCVHCHDPHKPAYPKVMPVFPPKLIRGEKESSGEHTK